MNDPNILNRFLTRQFHARWRHLAAVGAPLVLALGLCQIAQAQDPIITLQPSSKTISEGESVIFRATATTTNGPMSFQWQRDDPTVPVTFTNIPNATRSSFPLLNVTLEHAGDYRVIVANAAGESVTSDVARLEVVVPPFVRITEGPGADRDNSYSAAWTDYDRDGFIDLFVSNGGYRASRANLLYRNNGDGTFARMTTDQVGPIVGDLGGWRGCAWGDYNNDGYPDLFVGQTGKRMLYHNTGDGRFTRIADGGPLVADVTHVEGGLWGDYDNDGWLDVLVVSGSSSWGVRGPNWLYHNEGAGVFSKITTGPIPLDIPTVDVSYGGVWTDFDNDGDLDLVVAAGDSIRMFVYRNLGQGQFEAITEGDLPQDHCYALHVSSGDYDNDGLIDLLLVEYNSGSLQLFHNEGDGDFTKTILASGLPTPQSGAWGDYDNDGYLDLFVSCGERSVVNNRLYHNEGNGNFRQVAIGSLVNDQGDWGGAVWGDYDNDGFLDLFVSEDSSTGNALYHNQGNDNHWLMFKLEGTGSNRGAVGAKVRVQATVAGKEVWQMREVSGGHISQQDPRPHFGLGNATGALRVRVEWPSGAVQEWANVEADQILTLWEPPVTAAVVQPDSACVLSIRAEPNRGWMIQSSSDLAEWQTLTTVTSPTVGIEFVDSTATGMNCRFYRVMPE